MSSLLALSLGLVLTPLLALLGRRVGLMDRPTGVALKIHSEPRPLTGGIGVIAAALVADAVMGDGLEPLAAAAILFLLGVGVLDDFVALTPPTRLAAELTAGGMLAVAGVTFVPLGDLGPAAVVLAVPAVTNAVNVTDGQDGLAAGLAGVAALGMCVIAAVGAVVDPLGPALVASLVAFLVWNRPPASVFLGDGGAYGVGGLLVLFAASSSSTWPAMLGTIACLAVFGLELGSTLVRRVFARTLAGDRAHVYDLLAGRFQSRERATAAMVVAGVAAAAFGWLVSQLPLPVGIAAVAGAAVAGSIAVRALWRSAGVRLRRLREGTDDHSSDS